MNKSLASSGDTDDEQGMKCLCLERRQTTFIVASWLFFVMGRPVTKSTESSSQGRTGTGRGLREPNGAWRTALALRQVWQFLTYLSVSERIVGQKKSRDRSSKVLLRPGWPAAGESWCI